MQGLGRKEAKNFFDKEPFPRLSSTDDYFLIMPRRYISLLLRTVLRIAIIRLAIIRLVISIWVQVHVIIGLTSKYLCFVVHKYLCRILTKYVPRQ